MKNNKLSKTLSYWLRHEPEDIGLDMDSNAWVDVNELIEKGNTKDKISFDFNDLLEVVESNKKQRFSFDRDMCKIRANQGHSGRICEKFGIKIDSQIEIIPPDILYHGTKTESIEQIRESGLSKMSRQHVHLSIDTETAEIVAGRRKGEWSIIEIEAKKMHVAGYKILISKNGVYLTDNVPVEFIKFN